MERSSHFFGQFRHMAHQRRLFKRSSKSSISAQRHTCLIPNVSPYRGLLRLIPLRPDISSLDRLPVPLGGFISEAVYESKLRSSHNIVDHSCVVFIDVGKGEEAKKGQSYQASIPRRATLTKVTFVRVEHGGGPYGSQSCQTISSTAPQFLRHNVL